MVLTSIASISKFKIVSVHISCTLNKQIPYIFQGVPCMLLIHLLSRCGTWLAVHAGVTVIQLHSCLAHSSLNWGLCTLSWILAISSIFYLNPYLCLSYVVGFVVFGIWRLLQHCRAVIFCWQHNITCFLYINLSGACDSLVHVFFFYRSFVVFMNNIITNVVSSTHLTSKYVKCHSLLWPVGVSLVQ